MFSFSSNETSNSVRLWGRRPGYASASLEDGRGHSSGCGFSSWTQRWLLSQQGAKNRDNIWKTHEKHMKNTWKTYEKHMKNIWKHMHPLCIRYAASLCLLCKLSIYHILSLFIEDAEFPLINVFKCCSNVAYFPPTPSYSAKPFWKHTKFKWRCFSAWSQIFSLSHISNAHSIDGKGDMNEKKYSDWKWKGRNLERRLWFKRKGSTKKKALMNQKRPWS